MHSNFIVLQYSWILEDYKSEIIKLTKILIIDWWSFKTDESFLWRAENAVGIEIWICNQ